MNRAIRWTDYITINIYFLGLTTLSQTNGLVFPLLVQNFVGEAGQGAFFGNLRLWTLMVALLVQSGVGMISDHSNLRWGRRRPFIFTGTLLNLVFIFVIGFSIGMEGMGGYWFLLATAILLSISSNIAHSAQQGLIPDLVPEEKRGRFSGVKAFLELPIPLLLVSFTIARLIKGGNMWAGLVVAMGVLTVTMLITMFAPEKAPQEKSPPLNWKPFLRLVMMTAIFTAIILAAGRLVNLVGQLLLSIQSSGAMLVLMGLAGLGGMLLAVGLGVLVSVRVSLGEASRQNPAFSWWVVNRLAFLVGAINLSTFAIYYLQARLNIPGEAAAQPAANLMLIVGVFILISALPSGWLADRFGHKRLVALSGLTASIGTAIAILFPNLTLIYIGGCFLGVATGVFFTANWALGTKLVPKEEAARYLGISNLAGAGAGAVGAYIGGPLADYFTVNLPQLPGVGYVLLFAIYGSTFLLSILALNWVKLKDEAPLPLGELLPVK
jgi:MFS family permease